MPISGTGIPRQLAKDLWVIDENIFSEYRQARVIGQADWISLVA